MNARCVYLAGIFFLVCSAQHTPASDPLAQWHIVATPGHSLRGLAYKDGTFVAVGFSTNTVVSTNGTNWVRSSNGLQGGGLYAVAAGAGQFVAVGPNSIILSSIDGLQWTRRNVHTHDEYWAAIYGGGQFVAVGFSTLPNSSEPTVTLVSTDGVSWQRIGLPFNTTPRNVAFGNGIYVAPGWPHSMYSTNGRDWTLLSFIGASAVAFGNGQFVMAGTSAGYVSSNGRDWTTVLLPDEQYFTGTFANGRFMFGNGEKPYGLVAISTDGTSWSSQSFTAGGGSMAIRDIVFVNGHFYLADQLGGKIWRSGRLAPLSRPAVAHVAHRANETSFSFSAMPGFRYVVEQNENANASGWTEGARIFADTDSLTVRDTTATNRMRLYRVRVE